MSGGTTRFLGAAVHLDAALSESFIEEFLVEPTRSVPRSPGVDAAAVLGDAAASHRRRQIRDIVLLIFAVTALITYPATVVLWVLIAVGLALFGNGRTAQTRSAARTAVLVVAGIVVLVVASLSGIAAMVFATLLASVDDGSGSTSSVAHAAVASSVAGALALIAIPVVIISDELLVVTLVRRHFARQKFRHEPEDSDTGLVAALRRIGRDRFAAALARTRAAEADAGSVNEADVVVFRGDSPFVGAGTIIDRRALVVPLEREDESDDRPPQVSEEGLHDAVATAVGAVRRPSSLAPHARLEQLTRHEQVLVSAYDLLAHMPSAEAEMYLPRGLHAPPAATVPIDRARLGRTAPREWARYYQCFRVEGWERDLTVSCYFTLGTDGHLLYLEWAMCALPPLLEWYRLIDDHRALQNRALSIALAEIVTFPASLPARLRRAFRPFSPRSTSVGHVSPDQYGAAVSLRELAAGSVDDYFHSVDVMRYVNLFDRSILEAVRAYLKEHDLRLADFDRVAGDVYNIGSIKDSSFAAGRGARNHGSAGTRAAAEKKGS